MAEQQFEDYDIKAESRIQYRIATYPALITQLLEMAIVGEDVYLCHREDRHEDGSSSHYYYLELDQKQFALMGGKELEPSSV